MAEAQGLCFFSITDHNKVGAYDQIKNLRHLFCGKIIPAVELTTTYNNEVIEVLGYGIDTEKMDGLIKQAYPHFEAKDIIRLDVERLVELGVVMDKEFVKIMTESPWDIMNKKSSIPREYWLKEMKRHPENSRFFKSEEEFMNMKEGPFARQYLFNPSSPLFIDHSYMMAEYTQVLDMIRLCGGYSFLAHPFLYSKNITDNLSSFKGLDGVECHYGTFTKEQKQTLCDFCDANNLYKSGGSDFHGLQMRPQNVFARSDNEKIELSLISNWINEVKQI